jgi:hypothetical protein
MRTIISALLRFGGVNAPPKFIGYNQQYFYYSGYPVIDDESAPVREEVAAIDGRGRLYMQRRWTQRIAWWPTNPSEPFSVLINWNQTS